MLEEEQNAFETIEEIKSIKKKRANTEFSSVCLCLSNEAFYIISEKTRSAKSFKEIVNAKEFIEKISFAEVTDIIFPSFKNIAKKIKDKDRGFPFKILTVGEEYWVWVSEKYFWISRKLFEETMYIKENVG